AMRGIALINAVVLVAEVGDFTRFSNPRQLMAYFGLVPGEQSSSETVWRGGITKTGITKTGNTHARRALVEGAWAYRMRPRIGRHKVDRIEALPKVVRDIGWKAQVRLCTRYRRLSARGKNANVVNVAIAREMVGFIWSIACTVAKAVGIAASSVVKIWHDHGLAPHRWRSFKLSNDKAFAEKLHDVVGLYVSPPAHAIVLSVDEKR
ncbi:IS110 family transposase, partial [Mesorhizobium waimense]